MKEQEAARIAALNENNMPSAKTVNINIHDSTQSYKGPMVDAGPLPPKN